MGLKDSIKKILVENQERIPGLKVHAREVTLPSASCYIVTGPRRAGKTFLVYHRIQQYLQEGVGIQSILYINFEDERLMELDVSGLDLIMECHGELFNTKPLIFLDEIQNISGWQKFARRLADSGYVVVITGSNASMLSSEMASTLGGRYMIKEVETLSFAEFLRFYGESPSGNWEYDSSRFRIRQLFDQYLEFGGFPELFNIQEKRSYLQNVFQKIFLGDVVERHQIRNPAALRLMIKKLAENAMDEVSFTRIRNIIQSGGIPVGTATLIEYIGFLEDAFVLRSIRNYKAKITSRETNRKYYFTDHGMLSLFLVKPESSLLETMVHNHLQKMHPDKLYYLRDQSEVDFYVPGECLVQVAWSVANDVTLSREVNALLQAAESNPVKDLLLLTHDESEVIQQDGYTIHVVPAWKWLLSEKNGELPPPPYSL